jgi:hypothetical protein
LKKCRILEKGRPYRVFKMSIMKKLRLVFFPVFIFFSVKCVNAQDNGDPGWPRQVTDANGTLIYYQPQLDDWENYKLLTARMAFSLTSKNGKQVLGVASLNCETAVNKEKRMVYLNEVKIAEVRFPSLKADSAAMMEDLFKKLLPKNPNPIALDRLIADIDSSKKHVKGIPMKNDPPPIFYSSSPAIVLIVEGDSVLAPIEKLDVQYVVNTNWDLFFDKKKKDYYLLVGNIWAKSKLLKGPWAQTQTLPKEMDKLPAGQNFDDVKKMIPPQKTSSGLPKIFYSNVPSELILLKGAPVYTKINGTSLLYIANTDNNIFLDENTKLFYALLSGRWFSSKAFSGPWRYAGDNLPDDFAKIPQTSPKANVLSSVPGTTEASDAVMLAQIPQSAIVNKKEAQAQVRVNYDGDPKFVKIENTDMEYATNTSEKIIKLGDTYYLCYQAVWFTSTKPLGPWITADSVPKEIYSIPPSSPIYNVTYVTQTNATETTVESSTTAGYFGMFVVGMTVGACIAYGTGYYYPPYMYYGGMYPIYRPYPYAYGAGFAYNPWTGGYAGTRVAYGPYGAARTSAWYNPNTGRYGRSASVQTPWGGRSGASAYNPYTGGYGATRQGHNAYAQWGTSVAGRGDNWVQTGHVTTRNGTTGAYRTASGNSGVIHQGANGTAIKTNNGVYAGHDGNVYKKDAGGGWSQYNNGGWNQVDRNKVQTQNLGTSESARQRGQAQTSNFQNYQHHGGGSFGGGGFHGGGGFRGRR